MGELTIKDATIEIDRRVFGAGTGSWTGTTVVGAGVEIEITVEANRR